MGDEVNTVRVYMNFCIHSKHQKHYGFLRKMPALYDITLWCRGLLNKLTVTQQFKNLPAFYRTRRLIAVSNILPMISFLSHITSVHEASFGTEEDRENMRTLSTCHEGDSNRVPCFSLPPELIYSVK